MAEAQVSGDLRETIRWEEEYYCLKIHVGRLHCSVLKPAW